jgi:hypothetical protein
VAVSSHPLLLLPASPPPLQFTIIGGLEQTFSNDQDLLIPVNVDKSTFCSDAGAPTWQWASTGTPSFKWVAVHGWYACIASDVIHMLVRPSAQPARDLSMGTNKYT